MILELLAVAALTAQVDPDEITVVDGVEIVGVMRDYRLRVDLRGAQTADAMILSQDPPMYCGDARFDRTRGPSRQCWLRGLRGEPIILTAQHQGQYGRDWTVEWTGCEPQGDGRSCSAEILDEMMVGATFRHS